MRAEISIKNTKSKFLDKVEELSEQNIYACYQCGKCSAGCPSISEMDISPSEIIRLVQLGEEEEVLNSKTIWVCASCFRGRRSKNYGSSQADHFKEKCRLC